ncbi:MAG: HesA/MoeB/ThiF family protein [Candidatus Thorarchaeota archaeon]
MDYDRIRYILSPESLINKRVLVVGLGSGGAPVVQHLAMNGVRRWILYDFDILEEVNMVKHPGCRSDIGRPKIEIMKDWLLDRNPESEIEIYNENILSSNTFEDKVKSSDMVIAAPDTQGVREKINDMCITYQVPCVFGRVFRTGLGGDVFAYIPGVTGCFNCLTQVGRKQGWDRFEDLVPMTDDEKEKIYGIGVENYRASGLSMDIAMITSIHAKLALNWLLDDPSPEFFPEKNANYIIFYMRKIVLGEEAGTIPSLSSHKFTIPAQKDCTCSPSNSDTHDGNSNG